MAVLICPDWFVAESVACVVCGRQVTLAGVAVGVGGSLGQPAFACNSHMIEGARFMTAWVRSVQAEREREADRAAHQEFAEA